MAVNIGKAIADVAPTLGAALGGPVGGVVGTVARSVLKSILGLPDTSGDGEMEKAIATASPETLLALKKAENDFRLRLEELGVDLEKISKEDRDSARQREATVRDRMPTILGLSTVTLVAAFIYGMIFTPLESDKLQVAKEILLYLLGVVSGVYTYYFGSSSGSKLKTEMLARSDGK